jgi:DNA-binding MarR family transcriptional regulator
LVEGHRHDISSKASATGGFGPSPPDFAATCRFCVAAHLSICCGPDIRARFPGRFNVDHRNPDRRYDPFVKARLWVTIKPKYVNMADINFSSLSDRSAAEVGGKPPSPEPIWDIIELLFFAYRDFVSDPDDVLAKFNFGRAHHRVLHFVNRHPGMKVADLLDVLKITKQSLGRVLKQLVDEGYVIQKEGENDRRQRLLFVTTKGEQLAMKLAGLQTERIARALAEIGPNAHEAARRFLVAMIDADGREGVQKLIARADRARRPRT